MHDFLAFIAFDRWLPALRSLRSKHRRGGDPASRISNTLHTQMIAILCAVVAMGICGCVEHRNESAPITESTAADTPRSGFMVAATDKRSTESMDAVHTDNTSMPAEPMRAPRSPQSEAMLDPSDRRPPILEVEMLDRKEYGVPIGLFADKTLLMRRDGSIDFLENQYISRQRILAQRFESIDRNELSQQLYNEFGRRYAIKWEAPYIVVAHANHLGRWAHRFRNLYHSFRLYCKTHGLALREIEFPLVAMVLASQAEFHRYAEADGTKLPANCVGFYSQKSNRIVLYEAGEGLAQETLETICHEATHQLAFNSGLHQRLAATPLWLAEGLATMFESPRLSGLQQREGGSHWPDSRRHEWRLLAKNPSAMVTIMDSIVRSDTAFERDPLNAYCVSWALVAYLSQRHATAFGQYIQHVSRKPPYEAYSPAQRQADFQQYFGKDIRLLTKSVTTFIESLD
jgi:hypothetical protein